MNQIDILYWIALAISALLFIITFRFVMVSNDMKGWVRIVLMIALLASYFWWCWFLADTCGTASTVIDMLEEHTGIDIL